MKKRKLKIAPILTLILLIIIITLFVLIINKQTISRSQNSESINNESVDSLKKESVVESTDEVLTSNGFKIEVKDGVTYIDGHLIANKTYSLPENFIPTNTHTTATIETGACQLCIDEEVYKSFIKMQTDTKNQGMTIWIQSGYRSYNYQKSLYNNYVNRSGKSAADTYSARPGNSEHQTGLAFDLNSISDAFANTEEGKWINENCYKYGFIIRYPKDKDNETGYKYESWHLRYVGEELATKLYNNGDWITLESYLGITSSYTE